MKYVEVDADIQSVVCCGSGDNLNMFGNVIEKLSQPGEMNHAGLGLHVTLRTGPTEPNTLIGLTLTIQDRRQIMSVQYSTVQYSTVQFTSVLKCSIVQYWCDTNNTGLRDKLCQQGQNDKTRFIGLFYSGQNCISVGRQGPDNDKKCFSI